ncbi:hypothetical protein [Pseudohaliea rubra]|uniref:Uncharacterized protein n=1 Tax=Pseudohaliea rubra DSM 19751 TaxID=1265313 RepID=A0A095VQZ3_9GAMM|nr:hypothetical protein [Pseudohaliea rubra]KGE03887.1 hypothetical protein HRUBRA_01504 [Pseudohaliea rubra DSM 19751]
MKPSLRDLSLTLQLPLAAAALSLAVALALVLLAATSSRYLLTTQQADYGNALAQQIARRISSAMETGDLLSVAASLQRFVESSPTTMVEIYDVEGQALGRAGEDGHPGRVHYEAPVRIGQDIAGRVRIALDTGSARESRQRFLLSLSALAVVLSLLVFVLARYGAARLVARIAGAAERLALEGAPAPVAAGSELELLEARVDALPLELLRPRDAGAPSGEHYRTNTVLYLHLASLAGYVDTLNERNLHRYTDRLHRIIYAAAACYGGTLQVARPFGLALCFAEGEGTGSAALRAVACAALVREVANTLEAGMSLSLAMGMAVGRSELGPGDAADIYPGLYLQGVLDELRDACLQDREHVLVTEDAAADADLAGRADLRPEKPGFRRLVGFADAQGKLLERQAALLLARLRGRREAAA